MMTRFLFRKPIWDFSSLVIATFQRLVSAPLNPNLVSRNPHVNCFPISGVRIRAEAVQRSCIARTSLFTADADHVRLH